MNQEETFLSIKEFAGLAHVHPNTIRRAIRSGKLQAVNVGIGLRAHYRIPRSEISRIALFDLKILINRMIDDRFLAEKPVITEAT